MDDIDEAIKDVLEHHGTKGQKWGVRRNRDGSGTTGSPSKGTDRAKQIANRIAKKNALNSKLSSGKKTVYRKKAKRLSDGELERRIKRMEMEKKYSALNTKDTKRGKKVADKILEKSGEQIGTKVATATGLYVIARALKKTHPDLAKAIAPTDALKALKDATK